MHELVENSATIYVGSSHDSSEVHRQVIESLNSTQSKQAMINLRSFAQRAKESIVDRDINSLAAIANESTTNQGLLHSDVVSAKFRDVIGMAREHDALGCKVNGAGGLGGTVTAIFQDSARKQKFLEELVAKGLSSIPHKFSVQGMVVVSKTA